MAGSDKLKDAQRNLKHLKCKFSSSLKVREVYITIQAGYQ